MELTYAKIINIQVQNRQNGASSKIISRSHDLYKPTQLASEKGCKHLLLKSGLRSQAFKYFCK